MELNKTFTFKNIFKGYINLMNDILLWLSQCGKYPHIWGVIGLIYLVFAIWAGVEYESSIVGVAWFVTLLTCEISVLLMLIFLGISLWIFAAYFILRSFEYLFSTLFIWLNND